MDQEPEYYDKKYRGWHNWLMESRAYGVSWENIRMFEQDSEEKAISELNGFLKYNRGAVAMDLPAWQAFVDFWQEEEKKELPCNILANRSERGSGDRPLSSVPGAAWPRYESWLVEKKHFSPASVEDIRKSGQLVFNMLEDGTSEEKRAVRGLVMGNVQSGKTANMGALMSMTADHGFNVYIVLSGTIENLRQQTQSRFQEDLQSGNIAWQFLDNPLTEGVDNPSNLELQEGARQRYVITCLKNSSRLRNLCKWLNYDANKKRQMKVVLIDDESDQASLNTNKMTSAEQQERTAINQALLAIVNGWTAVDDHTFQSYAAMNYVAYTATPYGNMLNESGPESLYPQDFITLLETPDIYFGPAQIFGDRVNGKFPGMPIINPISDGSLDEENTDIDIIEEMLDYPPGDPSAPVIPESLQAAVAWFCVCVAIQRCRKSKKPVSMLVHHSMQTNYHAALAAGIRRWFSQLDEQELLDLCRQVYQAQTEKFNRETLAACYPEYGRTSGLKLPDDILDYPSFDSLQPFLHQLKETEPSHITMDDTGHRYYYEGLHICVDNCNYDAVCENGSSYEPVVRLIYPDKANPCDTDAPAFIVVGGNTLSRGLTLEGLVCTYFSRDTRQADSLMQMGRWFGYRRGYELLPRIWLTNAAVTRFEFLSELDITLRQDLVKYRSNITPEDCGPVIKTYPGAASMMRLTAANKMQGAVKAEMNFAGAHLQSFIFQNDQEQLAKNLSVAERFIESLGEYIPDTCIVDMAHVWEKVPFERIWEDLLSQSVYQLGTMDSMEAFHEWVEKISQQNRLKKWTVILSGRQRNDEKIWQGVGKVERSRILTGNRTADGREFSIGVLSDPGVWRADIRKSVMDALPEEDKSLLTAKKMAQEKNELQNRIREDQGQADIPRLVIYCIDKDSRAAVGTRRSKNRERCDLNAAADVIGIEILMPGSRLNKKFCASVTIKIDK